MTYLKLFYDYPQDTNLTNQFIGTMLYHGMKKHLKRKFYRARSRWGYMSQNNKGGFITLDESRLRLARNYNGQLPKHIQAFPAELELKFHPAQCAGCGRCSQLLFGYFCLNGETVLVSKCEETGCGWLQFPRLKHIKEKVMEQREECHEDRD